MNNSNKFKVEETLSLNFGEDNLKNAGCPLMMSDVYCAIYYRLIEQFPELDKRNASDCCLNYTGVGCPVKELTINIKFKEM